MSENNFRERSENELEQMSDEQLIAHMRAAREAGRQDQVDSAMGILAFGYWDIVLGRVLAKVPRTDAEDVASEIIISAIGSAFDSDSVGAFRAWLSQIIHRRIADYHRRKEGKPTLGALPTEHQGDEAVWGEEPSEEFSGDDLHARQCLKQVYEKRSDEHKQVLGMHVFGPATAKETADAIPGMTEDNVNQIASRFRKDYNDCLEAAD